MSSAHKHERYSAGDSPGGEKSRGNRLARRARSFKEDFLGIISQMRSPGGSGTRCGSRAESPTLPRPAADRPPAADMEAHVRQAQLALKHFRDVVAKDKLEMLPGNGTVVLETVTAIHVLLRKYLINEQSSMLVSATNQVYQSLAKLIRLCDDYLLVGDKALGRENVSEVLQLVDDAIQNLVSMTMDKLQAKETQRNSPAKPRILPERTPLDTTQRSSLPDIPLTPREREILEQTSAFVLERHSQSSENILRDDSPPPKPPHPDRAPIDGFPPPLPPKMRQKQFDGMFAVKTSLENLSLRSKSPGDSSSLFSASAGSLDSVLNHSREDELRNLLDESLNPPYLNGSSHSCCYWDTSSNASGDLKAADASLVQENSTTKHDRLSGSQAESGFSSMPSRRSSSQSFSTSSQRLSSSRSSQVSHCSQESQHIERKAISSVQKIQSGSLVDGSRLVTNGVSSSKQTTKVSYTSRSYVETCSCGHDALLDRPEIGDVIKYCPAHMPVSSHLVNPLEDGWSLFSSPSQDEDSPPALPEKTRPRVSKRERHPSQYDNVPEGSSVVLSMASSSQQSVVSRTETAMSGEDEVDTCLISHHSSSSQEFCAASGDQGLVSNAIMTEDARSTMVHSKTSSGVTEEALMRTEFSSLQTSVSGLGEGIPPPLPMKKKHMFQSVAYSVMAYMEMFGNASHGNTSEFMRHSVHVYQQRNTPDLILPSNINSIAIRSGHQSLDPQSLRAALPPALPPKRGRISSNRSNTSSPPTTPVHLVDPEAEHRLSTGLPLPDSPARSPILKESPKLGISQNEEPEKSDPSLLDLLDVGQFLVLKKNDDDGPDVRGGHPDALLIHATKAHKNDFLYQEAFLTTYRTFMSPLELIQKLCYRYDVFHNNQDAPKQRAARESFSLLVRVVNDLTLADVENVLLQTLMEFVQALLCRGDLSMAKALRVVMLSKYEAKKWHSAANNQVPSHHVTTRPSSLLDFKSEQIAEQMTLLDAELFLKIEIPEVLIWAQEQNEERSPNLTRFTEHFNKMSYWARSRILEQVDARERERYVVKYIKIMKHLRKINNFNSYLALLSALDSAPIRRLEWQKHITEGLKEYCALIDSSSSFRAYRQALAETQPPSIPYIGLVLQDLTFVHIGNSNSLADGGINFSKRWQQFNIVENMKRFKKGTYPYKKNERIIGFFNGFDESLSEEAMWQISEKIKPRGGKKL